MFLSIQRKDWTLYLQLFITQYVNILHIFNNVLTGLVVFVNNQMFLIVLQWLALLHF